VSWPVILAHLATTLALVQTLDPAVESEKARQLIAGGHPEQALPIYDQLVHAFPSNPDLLLNFAIAEFSAEHYRGAAEHALAALKLKPDLAPANLFLGASYLKLTEYSTAVDPLRKAVAAIPGDRNARLMLAEALAGSRQFQEALGPFQTAAELLPESPRVWYGLGQTYDALAEVACRKLQSEFPDSSYWLTIAADSYLKQRRFGSAFAAYREALARGPLIPGIHAGLARVYRETGHAQWAAREDTLEHGIAPLRETASGPAALYAVCRSYPELARQSYDRLDFLPSSLEGHLHRAKVLDAEGQHREAALEWREALKLVPADHSLLLGLAQSLYDGRDYEAVLPVAAEVLKQNSDSALANFLSGASLVSLERPEAAVSYLEAAARHDPQLRAPSNAALGQALLSSGKPEQAVPYLKSAIAGDKDGSSVFQLFRAYQLLGNRALSAQALAEYQSFRKSVEEQQSAEDGSRITGPSE